MIYDCFMFFNELDLLEIRLNELAKVVDYFVIVESHLTFSNKAKPLYYWRERKRFRSFEKQIIHIVVEDMPTGPNPWAREHHQRRALARALVKCQDQDIVIFSDADEIPKASVVASFNPQRGPQALQLMNCYYYVNCVSRERWEAPKILTYGEYRTRKHGDVQALRTKSFSSMARAGWHFSYFGGPTAIKAKLESFSHQELNHFPFNDEEHINRTLAKGDDLFGRNLGWKFVPFVEEDYPEFLVRNRMRFNDFIKQ